MKLTKIALGVALAAGTVAAQAGDKLWFPHVVVSGTVTTIATVIDTDPAGVMYTPRNQHWIYVGKNIAAGEERAVTNANKCSEVDVNLPFSVFDIQSVDLGNIIAKPGDYGVLFNDPSVRNNWRAGVVGKTYALADKYRAGAFATRGYLVVEDPDAADSTLAGYALVFDYKTGSAWGYTAETLKNTVLAEHNDVATGFGVHLMPTAEVVSRLMVTPVDNTTTGMLPGGAGFGELETSIAPVALAGGHVFNRDEDPISGQNPQSVKCIGTVDVHELISSGAAQFVPDGGWLKLATKLTAPATGAVVYQLDFGGEGATQKTLNGVGYTGGWNNLMVVQ